MKNAGYDFEVKTSSADEALPDNITPDEAVKYLAEIKGDAVEVDENTTDEEIRKAMTEAILEHQDAELCEDPDLEIEGHDIVNIEIDHEAAWTEHDEEEIRKF